MEIALENVWHSYDGETYVLRNISLRFRSPGTYLLIGPNGAGKTTLLKIVSFIIRPSRGRVLVDGASFWDLDNASRDSIRGSIVYVHDKPILVRGTVKFNVELGLRLKKRVDESIVEYYITRYGLKELENKSVNRLSAGQAKTVSIVRALVTEPTVLVLDEPFTYLDSTRSTLLIEDIMRIVRERGGMVLIATHYMYRELKALATEFVEIVNGEISSHAKNVFANS
ncbi:MAG: ABC transporter ATP-binding protein [Ignisphaera sp.]